MSPVNSPLNPLPPLSSDPPPGVATEGLVSLADGRRGLRGIIATVGTPTHENATLQSDELERRLLEMGFVEGARVEILHEGFIGRDPICVRLDDMRVALRRREARSVMVRMDANP